MKLKVVAENPAERIALALRLAPVTLMDTQLAFIRARTIMVGTKLGVFESPAEGPLDPAAVAARCGTHPAATEKLLNALVGAGYLTSRDGRYELADVPRRWALARSPQSLRDKLLFEFAEWRIMEQVESYVRTGQSLDIHDTTSEEDWALYQRGMRALAGLTGGEVARRMPVPTGATRMLDIGGSHGFLSVSLCRRHPGLSAVILDLPEAVAQAAPILAREEMGDRVIHRPGNALTDDLGAEAWDLILISQLMRHFDEPTCRALVERVARALRPGGVFVILELIRPDHPGGAGQVGALLDLYFALTSQSGNWSIQEMAGWQERAGLAPRKPIHLRTMPGAAAVVAAKPGSTAG
jgi:SAM-dependent methyltransferase